MRLLISLIMVGSLHFGHCCLAQQSSTQQPARQLKSSSMDICTHLVVHYTEVWHKHQDLSEQIQQGISHQVLPNYLKLLESMYKILVDTARLMEKHNCDLPEDF